MIELKSSRFPSPCRGRCINSPSVTTPDQSYTIRELMERSVCNAMPDVAEPVYYDDAQDDETLFSRSGIDLSSLDLVELQAYKAELQRFIDGFSGLEEKPDESKNVSEPDSGNITTE